MNTTRTFSLVAVITLALTAPPQSFAGDGVIEINQVKALAGGVTPGDTAGFPVTISQSGSYRLTSNLNITALATPANTTVILATASDVSIDLNGFSIIGSAVCSRGGSPGAFTSTCTGTGSGRGVDGASGLQRVSVRNGNVRGMGGDGVFLGDQSIVENLVVTSNGGSGITLTGGQVRHSVSSTNGGLGIRGVFSPLRVEGCIVRNNGTRGIMVLSDSVVLNNTSSQNVSVGIEVEGGRSVILGNIVTQNNSFGLVSEFADVGYGQNVFSGNNGAGAEVFGGAAQLGTNLCNGALCP